MEAGKSSGFEIGEYNCYPPTQQQPQPPPPQQQQQQQQQQQLLVQQQRERLQVIPSVPNSGYFQYGPGHQIIMPSTNFALQQSINGQIQLISSQPSTGPTAAAPHMFSARGKEVITAPGTPASFWQVQSMAPNTWAPTSSQPTFNRVYIRALSLPKVAIPRNILPSSSTLGAGSLLHMQTAPGVQMVQKMKPHKKRRPKTNVNHSNNMAPKPEVTHQQVTQVTTTATQSISSQEPQQSQPQQSTSPASTEVTNAAESVSAPLENGLVNDPVRDEALPRALVKPNILTHVINGNVIEESDSPFMPVLITPAKKAEGSPTKKARMASTEDMSSSAVEADQSNVSECIAPHSSDWMKKKPTEWTVADVYEFINALPGCSEYANEFRYQDIDGTALLLLKLSHLVSTMEVKVGPAIRILAEIDAMRE